MEEADVIDPMAVEIGNDDMSLDPLGAAAYQEYLDRNASNPMPLSPSVFLGMWSRLPEQQRRNLIERGAIPSSHEETDGSHLADLISYYMSQPKRQVAAISEMQSQL